MKIVHLCYSDLDGGAAKAAFRLHQAQRRAGMDSWMIVMEKRSDDAFVLVPPKQQRIRGRVLNLVSQKILARQVTSNATLHSLNWFGSGIVDFVNAHKADIVNLHWINGEMLSIRDIPRLQGKIVWTCHDMWPISGAEHYDDLENPDRYLTDYSSVTRPSVYRGPDLNKLTYKLKRHHWKPGLFHFVTPSTWLGECVSKSSLGRMHDVTVIPNCIDQRVYRPHDKSVARQLLGLPQDKKLLLFGAMSATDTRKGFRLLRDAIASLRDQQEFVDQFELVVFGASHGSYETEMGIKCHYLGRIHDDIALSLTYSAADVFVAPSIQDNLPNTLVESLSCGTPCVAFSIGGMPGMVVSGVTGSLVQPFDISALARGIQSVAVESGGVMDSCTGLVKERFSEEVVTSAYLNLYGRLL